MRIEAHAKINLTLDVGGLRPDGFHDVTMVMQEIGLHDMLHITMEGDMPPRLLCNSPAVPADDRNLCLKAALLFAQETGCSISGLTIHLEKYIPTMAGLGGGSADAAAVLRGLNELTGAGLSDAELCSIGLMVGSDVPFCIVGGTALATGQGERLTLLSPFPPCTALLIQPDFQISTGALFSAIDRATIQARPDTEGMISAIDQQDLKQIGSLLHNIFEQALPDDQRRLVEQIKSELLSHGALGAAMTGTGSVVFGLFEHKETAQAALSGLIGRYPYISLCGINQV